MSATNNEQPTTPSGAPEVDPSGSPIPAAEVARRAAFQGVLRARDSAYARKFRVLRISTAEDADDEGDWVCPSLPAAYHMLRDDEEIAKHVRVVKYEVPAHTGKAVALHWLILLLDEVREVEKVEVTFGVETEE